MMYSTSTKYITQYINHLANCRWHLKVLFFLFISEKLDDPNLITPELSSPWSLSWKEFLPQFIGSLTVHNLLFPKCVRLVAIASDNSSNVFWSGIVAIQ